MWAPPNAEEVQVNLELARFIIDGLMTLRKKTAGNLTAQEDGALKQMTAELQQAFVMCSQAVQETTLHGGKADSVVVTP